MGPVKETRTILGCEVTTQTLPYMRAAMLGAKLGKIAAPAMMHVGGFIQWDIAELLGAIQPDDLPTLMTEILAQTTLVKDGKQLPLGSREMQDLAFTGNLALAMAVLRFALEVNYSSFLVGGLGVSKVEESPSPQANPSTSAQT
jgi:hypothetical protein